MGSTSVSSCRCCMFSSCVHRVAVLDAAFCMTCSLLMLVEDASGDHVEEEYSKAALITVLYVAMSVSNSITSGVYPCLYRKAIVRPLLKKMGLDPNEYKNYRPVSIYL